MLSQLGRVAETCNIWLHAAAHEARKFEELFVKLPHKWWGAVQDSNLIRVKTEFSVCKLFQ